ncbi:hypothetical protein [Mycetocola zhujimingii]|uniref:hypothetical protein n=1 Tax=Mycetocola zhujimingii TaxID=2079792 RepID=UPI000D3355DB|nr:hypothetical protein [Mycetocola zhujimingii]AWB85274.1 hypothetical protein C3E77_00520 [Mycetocola zhujimingii]
MKRREVRAFYRSFAAQHPSVRNPIEVVRRIMLPLGALAFPIGLLALSFGISEEIEEANPDMVSELVAMFAIFGLFLYGGVLLCWASVRHRAQRGTPERHYRLAQFGFENGMAYLPGPLPGTHLTPWKERGQLILTRVMRPVSPRAVEFANYVLATETSGSRNSGFGGVVSMKLPNSLPHILLVAKNDRRVLPYAVPARAQVLSLEGNFDDHFTLYCPEGYEQDALYLFTPDVMAELIDRVNSFDVEIIDDWLFLESSRDVVTLDPETWHKVVTATAAITAKIDRWAQWRDDRLSAGSLPRGGDGQATMLPGGKQVAPRGRRLKMVAGNGAIVTGIFVAAYVAAVFIANSLP